MMSEQRLRLRFFFLLSFLILVGWHLLPGQEVAGATVYYVASLDAAIDPGAEDFVVSAINDARAVGANHFIFILNTFGGAGSNMERIINAISDYENAGNNFTTLIGPAGRHAWSAGAYIAEASTRIVMLDATSIGSATPIVTGIPGEEIASAQQKSINAFSTYMQTLADAHQRNATAAAIMVTQGVSYDNQDASRLHVVDQWLQVATIADAFVAMGVPSDTEIHKPGFRSQAISILSDPNLDALLFLLGTFAILADFTHPTLILSVIGATALALALFGFGVFGAPLTSIILMIIGALFIFLEIKTHHGVSAILGVIVFVVGFFLIFRTPPSPIQPSPQQPPSGNFFEIGVLTYGIIAAIAVAGIALVLYLYWIREELEKKTPHFDPKGLIGNEGRLVTNLKAGGVATANIGAEEWTVTAPVDMSKETRVRVKEVQGLKLLVEKVEA